MKHFNIAVGCVVAFVLCLIAFNYAHSEETQQHIPNTVKQWMIMHNSDESIGPSPSYWSQREMPLYIQNGCTEDVIHGTQACPF